MKTLAGDVVRGIWAENPPLRMLIGMCPVLAITTAAINGLIMGLAVTAVLLITGVIVSAMHRVIPDNVRIPVFVVIIATAVTVTDMTLAGLLPAVHDALGIFVPLIVVNCIILARAEAFASKHGVMRSAADALGMGLGEIWGLTLIAALRELLARGTIFGWQVLGDWFTPLGLFSLPPGAFLTLGAVVAGLNAAVRVAQERAQARKAAGMAGARVAEAAGMGGGVR
ncbi:MAG: electron transport complex subunit RsxE [Limnochordaceae bacterium]|nr:electron transport complex subunit RsxE [Limnochordaceae bacterium]